MQKWKAAQKWELDWHKNCVNSINEELKQLQYAKRMGLQLVPNAYTSIRFDLSGASILDIGSGPYSLLLKCDNIIGTVIDPLMIRFPQWVRDRYKAAGIRALTLDGESYKNDKDKYDEVWIYNVLQHTKRPKVIIKNARRMGRIIRIFEWIETPRNVGHLHTLTKSDLDKWLGGYGQTEMTNSNGLHGKCYYGVFPT